MILKMKRFTFLTVLSVIILVGINSCGTKDDPKPEADAPTMKSIEVSGENKNFEAQITFSEGVYKNTDMTGNLDENSFNVTLKGGNGIS